MTEDQNIINLLAKAHLDNVPQNNLSKKLGLNYVKIFYKLVLESQNSKILYILNNNKIESSVVIFTNYDAFNEEMAKKIKFKIFLDLISLNLPISSIFDRIRKKINEKKAFKLISNKCHLGFFFANKIFKPNSGIALKKNLEKLHSYALENNCSNIWGVVNDDNIKGEKFMTKLGYYVFFKSNGEIYLNKKLK